MSPGQGRRRPQWHGTFSAWKRRRRSGRFPARKLFRDHRRAGVRIVCNILLVGSRAEQRCDGNRLVCAELL